ncbi:hypothetical protein AURDEDRAFT_122115 [Auricularia subglabra TFB-10046 SS5]|nr:hypothetical protein AURDEDRAFT_122115 [Auricularia subglabra TFB-10046 SS5]
MSQSILDFNVSFGSLEMGTYVSMFLVGITTLQAWNYFRAFPGDPVPVKAMCYFGLRVLKITERKSLAFAIWILSAIRLGLTISLAVTARIDGTLVVVHSGSFKWQTSLATAVGAFTDITALALCTGLLRRRTGSTRSDKLIDRLVAFTVGSGLLTSIITVAHLITYLTMNGNCQSFGECAYHTLIPTFKAAHLRRDLKPPVATTPRALGAHSEPCAVLGTA